MSKLIYICNFITVGESCEELTNLYLFFVIMMMLVDEKVVIFKTGSEYIDTLIVGLYDEVIMVLLILVVCDCLEF